MKDERDAEGALFILRASPFILRCRAPREQGPTPHNSSSAAAAGSGTMLMGPRDVTKPVCGSMRYERTCGGASGSYRSGRAGVSSDRRSPVAVSCKSKTDTPGMYCDRPIDLTWRPSAS